MEWCLDHQQNPANPPSNQWQLNVLPQAHDAQKGRLTSSAKPLAHSVNQTFRSYPMMSAPKRSVRDCLSLFEPVCSAPVDEIAALIWVVSHHGCRLTRREQQNRKRDTCHCDAYRLNAMRLEIEKKHVGQYGDTLRLMHGGFNGRFSL